MKYVNWILVPIDFSAESRLALRAADEQAARWACGLILLHVKPDQPARTRLTIGESGLERWGRHLKHTPSNRVAFITCAGDPVDEILRIAEQYRPRKIIMGRGGNKQQAGSVARGVGEGFLGIVEAFSKDHEDVFVHAGAA